MTTGVFDLFTVGVGPSSSHTVGPMRAAHRFAGELRTVVAPTAVAAVEVHLFGSLAATGEGHRTVPAVLLGLAGCTPEDLDPDAADVTLARIRATGRVRLGGTGPEVTIAEEHVVVHRRLPEGMHPNTLTLTAVDDGGDAVHCRSYQSIGGGFIRCVEDPPDAGGPTGTDDQLAFDSAAKLLALTRERHARISDVMLAAEVGRSSVAGDDAARAADVRSRLLALRDVMVDCWHRGVARTGRLPGSLQVTRRAHDWHARLVAEDPDRSPEFAEDWVNLVALAVNEENAAGGRVVTAPTNGAAGIVPAVLHYTVHYTHAGRADPDETAFRFLLTAGAIGSLCKERASISGAEVGCQGEVGSAASMAAAGLAEALGGAPPQVENAAEIAMEHSLGLTCDPIAGLVQIPCIERNAISAGKAVNAARMALRGDGTHRVSLDEVLDTMRATGRDMSSKYKETSAGGLAVRVGVNVAAC